MARRGPAPAALLAPKLAPPVSPAGTIARDRLVRLLDRAAANRLTLVAGTPGSGKTVLLSSWARSLGSTPYGWLTLDEDDDDPARLWPYLLGAIAAIDAAAAGVVRHELPPDGIEFDDRAVLELINALAAPSMPGEAYLVLDDVHVLRNASVRRCLGRLVEHGPPWLHFVIGSRSDPLLPLHRMRARGELLEIRDDDLRFVRDEVVAYFSALGLPDLGTAEIDLLHERTEGWAAGLQLAALSLRRTDDRVAFVEKLAGSNRHVADFLLTEVLDRQPDDIRQFLLDTSLFDVLTADLCAAVTGRADAGDVLDELEHEHLFLVTLDPQQRTYRYHGLFRELLRFELRASQPDRIREVQVAAAAWHESRDDAPAAVDALLAAGAYPDALRVMESNAVRYYDQGQIAVLRKWLAATPAEALGHDVWALLGHAVRLLYAGELEGFEDALDRIDAWRSNGSDAAAQACTTLFRGIAALYRSEVVTAEVALDRAWQQLTSGTGADDPHVRGLAPVRRAHCWVGVARACAGRFADAREAVARPLYPDEFDGIGDLFAQSVRALISYFEGRLTDADRQARHVIAETTALGVRGHHCAWSALLTRGLVALEHNELATAEHVLQECVDAAQVPAQNVFRLAGELGIVAVWEQAGRVGDAVALLSRLRHRDGTSLSPPVSSWLDHAEARAMLRLGETAAADDLLARLPLSPWTALTGIAIDVAGGAPVDTATRARALSRVTPRERLVGALVDVHTAVANGDDGAAGAAVATIVDIGGREGYVSALLDAGPDLLDVLEQRADDQRGYVLAVRRAAEVGIPGVVGSGAAVRLVEPLSERERQVLRYLATRLSAREVARELFISVNTVKTHIQSIYRKLGCTSREEAVERARLLRILR